MLIGVVSGWLVARLDREAVDARYRIFDLGVRVEVSSNQRNGTRVAFAPDAHAIAFASRGKIWVRDLGESEPYALDGSDGGFAPFLVAGLQPGRLVHRAASLASFRPGRTPGHRL